MHTYDDLYCSTPAPGPAEERIAQEVDFISRHPGVWSVTDLGQQETATGPHYRTRFVFCEDHVHELVYVSFGGRVFLTSKELT